MPETAPAPPARTRRFRALQAGVCGAAALLLASLLPGVPWARWPELLFFTALAVAALGVGVGLVGTILVSRFLAALLYEVSPTDGVVLALSAAVLLLVAAVASWIPARRAALVDLAGTLRSE